MERSRSIKDLGYRICVTFNENEFYYIWVYYIEKISSLPWSYSKIVVFGIFEGLESKCPDTTIAILS